MKELNYITLTALSNAVEILKRINDAHNEDGKNQRTNPIQIELDHLKTVNGITDLFVMSDISELRDFVHVKMNEDSPMGTFCSDLYGDGEFARSKNVFQALAYIVNLTSKREHLHELVDEIIEHLFTDLFRYVVEAEEQ
jgi:hypothetical protein